MIFDHTDAKNKEIRNNNTTFDNFSAGGTGVLINLDRVADFLRGFRSRIQVRGLADSGWFLDNEPYRPQECTTDPQTCAPVEAIKRGVK